MVTNGGGGRLLKGAGWMALGFALGCIPTGRLVTRALTHRSLTELGDGKPGTSNVAHSLGWKPAAVVLALDAAKAFVPARAARLAGAGDALVAATAISAVLGHIALVRGRGVASALGAACAMDPAAMAIDCVPLVAGGLVHRHAESVTVAAIALPLLSVILHRRRPRRALGPLTLILIVFAARLTASGASLPHDRRALRNRLWLDRDA